MSAEIPYKVAHLGPDASIFMKYKHFEVVVDGRLVNVFIEILGDSCQLRYQAERVHYYRGLVILGKQLILGYVSEASARDKLLSECFR